jgi:hypothetical protein
MLSVLAGCGAADAPPAAPSAAPTHAPTAKPLDAGPLVLRTPYTRTFDLATVMLSVRGLSRSASGSLAVLSDGDTTATLVVLDPTSGQVRWEVPVAETGKGYIHASGVGFAGEDVVLGGQFASRLAVSGNPTLAAASESAFVLRFDGTGKLIASSAITGEGISIPGFAVDASGAALFGGAFQREVRLGRVTLSGTGAGDDVAGNLFIARLAQGGVTAWATEIRGKASIEHVVDGGAGRVLVAGDFLGTFAPAGETLVGKDSDRRGHYLAALDGAGKVRWVQEIGVDAIVTLADGSGDVAVCGAASGKDRRPRLLVIRPDGQKRLDRELELNSCCDLAPGDGGRLFVSGVADLPPATDGSSRTELRVVELDPQGATISSATLPFAMAPSTAFALVPDGHGGVFVAGSFIDFEKKQGKVIVHRVGR